VPRFRRYSQELGGSVNTRQELRGGELIRNRALSLVLVLGALNSPSHAQSPDAVAKQFIGMWRLVSWPQRLADGTTRQDPRSVAYIIYTDSGQMCSVGMAPDRSRWQSETAPTASEALAAMGGAGLYAYCARVEVHAEEGFVLHHVEIDKSPNFVGQTRKRWFAFQGPNRVALRIDTAELTGPVVESTLIWERVENREAVSR
jgi:Lipocalin-like domain